MSTNGVATQTPLIRPEGNRLIINGPLTLDAPDGAAHFQRIPDSERPSELRRAVELGVQAIDTIRTSTTLRLVEAELAAGAKSMQGQLSELLIRDRGEALSTMRQTLDDHRAKWTDSVAKYLDPASQASLPTLMRGVFEEATAAAQKQAEALLASGGDNALSRLAEQLSTEIRKGSAQVIEQMAARHALTTKSALAGRPYEEALRDRLVSLTRPLGDQVVPCGDVMGQLRRKVGDLLIAINPSVVRGQAACIVIEAKRRAEGSQAFSTSAIHTSLGLCRRNRGAQAALFVAEGAGLLPNGIGFQELGPHEIAVAYEPAGDDLGLAVAIRLLRSALIASLLPADDEDVDREAARAVIADIRQWIGKLEVVRGQNQAAVNNINRALGATDELGERILASLRRLDEILLG